MPKDHIIAQVVNDLRDTAIKFHDTQQLRERLRGCIEPLLAAAAPQVVADERAQNNPLAHTWPAEIFLQVGDCDRDAGLSYDDARQGEITWCFESIDKGDVRYVRAVAPVQAQEPVAEKCDVGCKKASDCWDSDQCTKTWPAPVQPVAVPEGWREFIENIATPRSEPLNSICSYRDNASRRVHMGALRAKAAELLAAAPAAQGYAKDAERMDFLVNHIVEVRKEQRYGSSFLFISQAQYDEGQEFTGTTLRAQIDAAIAAKATS